jgi:hypothetical protein
MQPRKNHDHKITEAKEAYVENWESRVETGLEWGWSGWHCQEVSLVADLFF